MQVPDRLRDRLPPVSVVLMTKPRRLTTRRAATGLQAVAATRQMRNNTGSQQSPAKGMRPPADAAARYDYQVRTTL